MLYVMLAVMTAAMLYVGRMVDRMRADLATAEAAVARLGARVEKLERRPLAPGRVSEVVGRRFADVPSVADPVDPRGRTWVGLGRPGPLEREPAEKGEVR